MAEERKLTFAFEKETKNTIRFQEEAEPGQPPVIGTLYVAKWFAQGAKRVEVTVKVIKAPGE